MDALNEAMLEEALLEFRQRERAHAHGDNTKSEVYGECANILEYALRGPIIVKPVAPESRARSRKR